MFMKLEDRKENILDFIVRDFIKTANPVSSGRISERKAFAASSATIRNIMLELDNDGYLYQPHTSAGRAPTDKGYRYFVDNLILVSDKAFGTARPHLEFPSALSEAPLLEAIVADFSHELRVFASATFFGENTFHALAGFRDVFREPEFHDDSMLQNFGELVDGVEEVAKEYRDALSEEDEIFDFWIGDENIHPNARGGSTLVARIGLPASLAKRGEPENELILFTFGPKRMNYEKAIIKMRDLIENIQ